MSQNTQEESILARVRNKIKNFIKIFAGIKFEDNGRYSYYLKLPFSFKQSGFDALEQSGSGFSSAIKFFLARFFLVEPKGSGEVKLRLKLPFSWSSRERYAARYGSLPVQNNKILFDNYMGKGFGCNPKYVAEQLIEKYPGQFDLVWITSTADMDRGDFPPEIRLAAYSSAQALREYATAKVWVSNYHKVSFVKRGMFKRPEQCFIQMWHGSLGIKKIEGDVSGLTQDDNWLKLSQQSSGMVDYWISNSKFETEIYKTAFWDVHTVKEYGHPRNDILFDNARMREIRRKLSRHFGIEGKKVMFYAPTFREDYRLDCYQIDYQALRSSLKKRFGGDWAILVRLHPRVRKYADSVVPDLPYVFDATFYTDIQELIAGADCMITDYSSCVFDFMLTRRPAFLYATDISEFDNERGFYYPLESTPFPIAADNAQLMENVEQFSEEKYTAGVDAFLREKGCIEDGHAGERVVQLIMEAVG